jgi:hypothetical protein
MEHLNFSRKNVRIAVGKMRSGETVIFTTEGEPHSVLMPYNEYLKLLAKNNQHIKRIGKDGK